LEIYGVVSVGQVQKALLKLGKRFANVPVGPTGLASVSVGTAIGEFILAKVEPDQILLQAPGGQQWVRFSIKKERTAKGNAPAGASMPASTPIAASAPMAVPAPAANPFGAVIQPPVAASAPMDAPAQQAPAMPSPPPPAAPGSLAAAIAAAQAAQAASGSAVAPAIPPGMNPFEALLKQQGR
jgi:hypothetical protein